MRKKMAMVKTATCFDNKPSPPVLVKSDTYKGGGEGLGFAPREILFVYFTYYEPL
jgi:hypothetical protein